MITRITIESGDKFSITRTTVRYEAPDSGHRWTVTSDAASFEKMFRNLCDEVKNLSALAGRWDGGEKTTFTITEEDGKKTKYILNQPEEEYAVCFTIIDQMVREAKPAAQAQKANRPGF